MKLRRLFNVYLLLVFGSSLAQTSVTCERLLETITTAFDVATEVKMTTQIMQGSREFAYSKLRLYKDEAGEWQSETLEQRGVNRPPDSDGQEDGAQPTFDLDCEGHTLVETEVGWDLTLPQQGEDSPVKQWDISLIRRADTIVPTRVAGAFEARLLFIPFKGSFMSEFAEWQIPLVAPEQTNNR
jgi:hypothetical protein